MKKSHTLFLFTNLITCFSVFAQTAETPYLEEIKQWDSDRLKRLKSETGWPTVAGLYWLAEGENTAGSSKENKIVFPKGKAADKIGSFLLKNGEVSLSVLPGVEVKLNDALFTTGIIFNSKMEEQEILLSHKNLRWFIIKRGDKFGIRLRDLESDTRKNFTHVDRFPVDEKWKIVATYEPPVGKKTIPIQDVIGLTTETPFGGTLHFEVDGKKVQLDATLEGDDLFIMLTDGTSGNTTYGAGRFLYAKKPEKGNAVILDFNKAYNPPCVFTDFATCPLTPDQNKLAIEITAGEKTYER